MLLSSHYLRKGGRITPAVAAFATVLNIKPVLTIQGDKLDTHAKARGMKQAQTTMLRSIQEDRNTRFADFSNDSLQIDIAGTLEKEEDINKWLDMVQATFPDLPIHYYNLPCSIACHVGINAAGIGLSKKAFFEK